MKTQIEKRDIEIYYCEKCRFKTENKAQISVHEKFHKQLECDHKKFNVCLQYNEDYCLEGYCELCGKSASITIDPYHEEFESIFKAIGGMDKVHTKRAKKLQELKDFESKIKTFEAEHHRQITQNELNIITPNDLYNL